MRDTLIGFTCSLEMSGRFISLLWFLSHHNKDLEWWTNYSSGRISWLLSHHSKDLRQQTGYSSSRQIFYLIEDSTLPRCENRPAPKDWPQALLTSLFILPISSWFCPVQNRAYIHHQSGKGLQMGIHSRPIESCRLYNNRLCCACLSHTQSAIIRCMYI